jgi:hypothetical protein
MSRYVALCRAHGDKGSGSIGQFLTIIATLEQVRIDVSRHHD